MKAEYGLSKMKSRRNPCASKLKQSVAMRLFGQKSENPDQATEGDLTLGSEASKGNGNAH